MRLYTLCPNCKKLKERIVKNPFKDITCEVCDYSFYCYANSSQKRKTRLKIIKLLEPIRKERLAEYNLRNKEKHQELREKELKSQKCSLCNSTFSLEKHHIIRRADEGSKDQTVIFLCKPCHKLIHKFMHIMFRLNYQICKNRGDYKQTVIIE